MNLTSRPKAIVYIDGFNFYRRIVDGTPYKWLDLEMMCSLLFPEYEVTTIKYFTARVKPTPHDESQHVRQEIYFRALRMNPKIELILGQFRSEAKSFPVHPWDYDENGSPLLAKVRFSQEKGSDVNLASHLIFDALKGKSDVYVVITNDSDQVGPFNLLLEEKHVHLGLVVPEGAPAKQLLGLNVPIIRTLRQSVLKASQLTTVLEDKHGPFSKPESW